MMLLRTPACFLTAGFPDFFLFVRSGKRDLQENEFLANVEKYAFLC